MGEAFLMGQGSGAGPAYAEEHGSVAVSDSTTITLAKDAIAIFAWGHYAPTANASAQGGGFLLVGGSFVQQYSISGYYVNNITYNSATKQATITVSTNVTNMQWCAIEKA